MPQKYKTIKETHNALVNKEISCVDLTKSFLSWSKKRQSDINSYITILEHEALVQAKKVDEKIRKGEEIGLLEGVPCAIKDNILIKDVKVTAGSRILENYIATYDATVIKKLKESGVIFLGKTNMDEFAMGSSGENSAFGATKNPIDLTLVPGGSSSGSTASVADNQCVFALGSDTGGSIRQPASFCGVVGFKPSYGQVSRYGLMAMASSFDQIGPIANSVADIKTIFSVLKTEDKKDSTNFKEKHQTENNENVIVGVPKEFFIKGMDQDVEKIIKKFIEKLGKEKNIIIKEISLPNINYSLAVYYILMPAEISSNLARYDGVKYGLRDEGGNLLETYLKTRAKGFGSEVKRRLMLGTYVLSSGYQEKYYEKAQVVRELIKQDFKKAFEQVDFIVSPTTPTTAFKLNEKFENPLTMYLSDIFTVSANVAGLPAISLPISYKENLPVGLQLVGEAFSDDFLLDFAEKIETLKN